NRCMVITLLLISLIVPLSFVGCMGQTTTVTTSTRSYSIVKTTDITDLEGTKWQICQLTLVLQGGGTFTVDLNLTVNDKVNCWYNTEQPASGGNVGFQVEAGTTVIYPSGTTNSADPGNTSDNLSFNVTQADGTSYRLIFHNNVPDINSSET